MESAYKTALIVEDSPTMRQLLVYAVGRLDLETVEAADGVDALKKLSEITPDIILADINMPVMDGLKLVKRVRSDERLRLIPIVIITTEGADEDRDRALALGANAFVTKPIQAPQVVELVRGLLEGSAAAAAGADADAGSTTERAATEPAE